jgi:hypothetical protein
LLVLILAAGVAASTAYAQPTALDEQGLADVTAVSPRPSAVVIDSSASIASLSEVALTETTQRQLIAANLANVAGADNGNGTNILSASGQGTRDLVLSQTNDITQVGTGSATLASYAKGQSVASEIRDSGARQSGEIHSRIALAADREVTHEETTLRFTATVLATGEGPFDGDGVTIQARPIVIPGIVLNIFEGVTINDEKVGAVSITLGETTFRPGPVVIRGADITVGGGTLELPDFDVSPLGTLSGLTVSLPSVTLPIDNPLADLRFRAGYAAYGSGTLDTVPGEIELAVDIPLNLSFFFGDASIGIPDTNITLRAADIGFPDVNFSFESSIPLELPASFERRFTDSVACLPDSPCGTVEKTVESSSEVDRGTAAHEARTGFGSEVRNRSASTSTSGAVAATEADARLQALSSSSLTEKSYSVVIVSDQAQSGMSTMSSTNAARAIVGNGLNVAASAGAALPSPEPSNSNLSQLNTFLQVGGL